MTSTNLFDVLPHSLRDPDKIWGVINWLLLHNLSYRDRRKLLTHWAKAYNIELQPPHFRRLLNGNSNAQP